MEPYRLFNAEGQWYAQARAVEVDELRNFRLDRMRNVAITEEVFEAPIDVPDPVVYTARSDDPELVLDLDADARWVVEQYPIVDTEIRDDGSLRVTLRVSEQAWAERLLLRLGLHARVIRGDIDLTDSARKVLRRYDEETENEAGRST